MKTVICSERIRHEDEATLLSLGFEVIKLRKNCRIENSLGFHTDLSLFFLEDRFFTSEDFLSENRSAFSKIEEKGYFPILIGNAPTSPYPADVPLCIRRVGESALVANEKYTAKEVLRYAKENGFEIINVKQGYAACTCLSIGGLISSDRGILGKVSEKGIRTLEIRPGSILLEGFDQGFIGGASGFDGKKIHFLGDLDLHPDAESIRHFASEFGIECVSLSKLPLEDIGGLLFI